MLFDGNTYRNNSSYGLDPHDDSDYLTITNNTFDANGNHGLICSQRCDHLVIRGNTSKNNGVGKTYLPPGDNDPRDNQVHGIMLHRGITDSIVENNTVTGQTTGAGIAVFDSVGNTIKNNTITGNKFGMRFSVGARDTVVTANTVKDSTQNAIYTYKGSDAPAYTGTSGRPSGITFTDNTFIGATTIGTELFKVQEADHFTFTGGSVTPGALTATRGLKFDRAQQHVFNSSVVTPAGTTFVLRGTTETPTTLTLNGVNPTSVKIDKDSYSTATFTTV
jgi:parallel beta-helix repeat protein